jgi:hypothetical protein
MATYKLATVPASGERIGYADGKRTVPGNPGISFVEGDSTKPGHLARLGPHLRHRDRNSVRRRTPRRVNGSFRRRQRVHAMSTSAFGDQIITAMTR